MNNATDNLSYVWQSSLPSTIARSVVMMDWPRVSHPTSSHPSLSTMRWTRRAVSEAYPVCVCVCEREIVYVRVAKVPEQSPRNKWHSARQQQVSNTQRCDMTKRGTSYALLCSHCGECWNAEHVQGAGRGQTTWPRPCENARGKLHQGLWKAVDSPIASQSATPNSAPPLREHHGQVHLATTPGSNMQAH